MSIPAIAGSGTLKELAAQAVAKTQALPAVLHLTKAPPTTLFKLLATCPNGGKGLRVAPARWARRGHPPSCHYYVTGSNIDLETMHGKVYGCKYWHGRYEGWRKINKGLKWKWHIVPKEEEPN